MHHAWFSIVNECSEVPDNNYLSYSVPAQNVSLPLGCLLLAIARSSKSVLLQLRQEGFSHVQDQSEYLSSEARSLGYESFL